MPFVPLVGWFDRDLKVIRCQTANRDCATQTSEFHLSNDNEEYVKVMQASDQHIGLSSYPSRRHTPGEK